MLGLPRNLGFTSLGEPRSVLHAWKTQKYGFYGCGNPLAVREEKEDGARRDTTKEKVDQQGRDRSGGKGKKERKGLGKKGCFMIDMYFQKFC